MKKTLGFGQRRYGAKDKDPQFGFNAMMGAGYGQYAGSKFRPNKDSSNDIRTYNPFLKTVEDLGADG